MLEKDNAMPPSVFEGISDQLGVGVVVADGEGRVLWANSCMSARFPSFSWNETFDGFLARLGPPAPEAGNGGEAYRIDEGAGRERHYRHLVFPLDDAAGLLYTHCLVDVTREKKLEERFLDHLQQLTSMKEIVDALYGTVANDEVLYLILVAVTSQMGFGFNRAFYLEARAGRLRGKIGIGPSSNEDAHRIWGNLARLDLPDLRAIYDNLTRNGLPPDPETQGIAERIDLPLRETGGLLRTIESRRTALLEGSRASTEVERGLFGLLATEAVAVVPLHVRDSLVGLIIADNFVTKQPITQKSLNLLRTFSGYAGIAVERSQLYEELKTSVVKLRGANERLRGHQEKLLKAEKLSTLGELAARVSHEIRNPLVAIGGLARSLLRDGATEDGRARVETIVREVSRLEKFLRETLDFVKPEVGLRSVDLRHELERCVSTMREDTARNGVRVELLLDDVELRSRIDPDLLHRALSNLIKNGVEAQPGGGKIVIEARDTGLGAELRIADRGPGIPAEIRSRIFEPFFTTKAEGTGLGLAIAAQNVKSLGGKIVLEESPEGGALFAITLPLEKRGRRSPGRRLRHPAGRSFETKGRAT